VSLLDDELEFPKLNRGKTTGSAGKNGGGEKNRLVVHCSEIMKNKPIQPFFEVHIYSAVLQQSI
jgi:hypothetical protein